MTNLGVHAKVAPEEATVWVTGADDGRPRGGATVVLRDRAGRPLATGRTDAAGLVRLTGFRAYPADTAPGDEEIGASTATPMLLGADRTLVGVREYDPDLSAWRFNVSPAWGADRLQAAGAMFTERGIYRPGETIHAKAIVRAGMLGRLEAARDLSAGYSEPRRERLWRDTTLALSPFGTSEQHVDSSDAKLGDYRAEVQVRRRGEWSTLAVATYRIAEYRPPEFLVDVNAPSSPRIAGDSLRAVVEARRPLRRAHGARRRELVAPAGADRRMGARDSRHGRVVRGCDRPLVGGDLGGPARGSARCGAGHARRRRPSGAGSSAPAPYQRTRRASDARRDRHRVNRQTVSASTSAIVHPAAFYIAAVERARSISGAPGRRPG